MGFFSRLVSGLKNTKKSFAEKLKYVFTGNDIDEDFYEELEYILISADIGTSATEEILDNLREEAKSRKLKKTDECREVLKEILVDILSRTEAEEYSYPLATFAGYHFWNQAVNTPIRIGRILLIIPK